jgi:hypothetical protein
MEASQQSLGCSGGHSWSAAGQHCVLLAAMHWSPSLQHTLPPPTWLMGHPNDPCGQQSSLALFKQVSFWSQQRLPQ